MRDILNTRFPTGLEADTYIGSAIHNARVPAERFCLSDDENVRGADEEELVTTLITIGSPDARHIIWVDDGEHGCEDMIFVVALGHILECISHWNRLLGNNVCIRWIHNANPWGRSYYSRFTHEGGDANRGFRDTFAKEPLSREYKAADECLNMRKITFIHALRSLVRMHAVWNELGEAGVRKVIAEAQSFDPKRILWTGNKPFWTNRTIEHIIDTYTPDSFGFDIGINCHTGLGPFGKPYFISIYPPNDERYRQSELIWNGNLVSVHDPNCLSFASDGTIEHAFEAATQRKIKRQYIGICLEIGTWNMAKQVASVVLRHNVLKHNLPEHTPLARLSRKAIGWSYYPPLRKWREESVKKFLLALERTIKATRNTNLLRAQKAPT